MFTKIIIFTFTFLAFLTFICGNANAKVREVYVNSSEMEKIYLKMGQSTVLRFNESPIKGVVGNQNYYNVEFVKNTNDVTIQPLGPVDTNLFIYCKYHTYGFLLKVKDHKSYDDLVKIRWSTKYRKSTSKKKRAKNKKQRFEIKDTLSFEVLDVSYNAFAKLWIIDMDVQNIGPESIILDNLGLSITRRNKPLSFKKPIISKKVIKQNEKAKIRIFLVLIKKRGFTINANYNDKHSKFIISKEKLK